MSKKLILWTSVVVSLALIITAFPYTKNNARAASPASIHEIRIAQTGTNDVVVPILTIMQIQGAGHKSTYLGQAVKTSGVVTVVRGTSFYLQDPLGDADPATSDGILVFTGTTPGVLVGDALEVSGTVTEFYPGGYSSNNLSTTEITGPAIVVVSSGNPLPTATVIGTGGRLPPTMVIEDDASGDVETSGLFDPESDGIDFYESLESMLVQVNNAVAVSGTNAFGEIAVVSDLGTLAGLRSERGGLVVQASDFNPERIILDDAILPMPDVNTGDTFPNPLVGVLDYAFGNFKLLVSQPFSTLSSGLGREICEEAVPGELSVVTFNVENLDPNDPEIKFNGLADLIVNNLKAPDILGLQEVQDNNGATNDGVVEASQTYNRLIQAIQFAGGPIYAFRDIPPQNNLDGGEPGSNIRVGFLFRTDRGLSFVDRPGGDATTATAAVLGSSGVELTFSPGRIDPQNPAFLESRKPLVGEFLFNGDKVFVVVNHFNSKSGDTPLFGRIQPPVLSSEAQRMQQAQVVNTFVGNLLALDPQARVFVIGDFNDFQFSVPLVTLKGSLLTNLVEALPAAEQYTYVYDGNAQVLDNFLVSGKLLSYNHNFDIVHMNAEFAVPYQVTDHDPALGQFCLDNTPPEVTVTVDPTELWPDNHKYVTVHATVTVTDNIDPDPSVGLVMLTSDEPDDALGDGHTINDMVILDEYTFDLRAERSGTGDGRIYTIAYRGSDACGNAILAYAYVSVPHDQGQKVEKELFERGVVWAVSQNLIFLPVANR